MSRAFCRLQSNPRQPVGPPAKKGLDLAHIHSVRFETDPILYFQFTVLHPLALNMTDWLYPLLYTLLALGAVVFCLPIALSLHYRRDDLPTTWHLLVQLAFFSRWIGHRLPTRTRGAHPHARTAGTRFALSGADTGHRAHN